MFDSLYLHLLYFPIDCSIDHQFFSYQPGLLVCIYCTSSIVIIFQDEDEISRIIVGPALDAMRVVVGENNIFGPAYLNTFSLICFRAVLLYIIDHIIV